MTNSKLSFSSSLHFFSSLLPVSVRSLVEASILWGIQRYPCWDELSSSHDAQTHQWAVISSDSELIPLPCDLLSQPEGVDQCPSVPYGHFYSRNRFCKCLTVGVSDLEAVDKIVSGKQFINHKLQTMLPACFIQGKYVKRPFINFL